MSCRWCGASLLALAAPTARLFAAGAALIRADATLLTTSKPVFAAVASILSTTPLEAISSLKVSDWKRSDDGAIWYSRA